MKASRAFDPGSNPGTSTLALILLKRGIESLFFTQKMGFQKQKFHFGARVIWDVAFQRMI